MKTYNVRRSFIAAIMGLFALTGAAVVSNAQNPNDEYREWQNAQRVAQEEYRDYLRTRSRRDYRDWQQAQRRAQQEYREYQRSTRMNNNVARRYRIYRDGRYYNIDNRGADLLRQAVNRGYQQGYTAGQRDRRFGRRYEYNDEVLYQRGNFGYQSYIARDQYEYYFREGFQRGYEDGFYSTTRYGYRAGNSWSILGNVLNTILNIAQY
jgi:flagellar biosynthesis/type III secretory pathway protein FliH